jgi:hypothetical protein
MVQLRLTSLKPEKQRLPNRMWCLFSGSCLSHLNHRLLHEKINPNMYFFVYSAIGIIKAASDFVRSCCSALLIPLYISILQTICIAFWAVTMLYIFSSNDSDREPIERTPFSMVDWNEDVQKLAIVYAVGIIWYL